MGLSLGGSANKDVSSHQIKGSVPGSLVTQVKSTRLQSSGRVSFLKVESGKVGTDRVRVMSPGMKEEGSCARPSSPV